MRLPFAMLRFPLAWSTSQYHVQRGKKDIGRRHAYQCRTCAQWSGPFRVHMNRTSECHPDAGLARHVPVVGWKCPKCSRILYYYAAANPRSPIEHVTEDHHVPEPLFTKTG